MSGLRGQGVVVASKPMELVLMARVARRYYQDDRSKIDIADELGISRFRVARLLAAAKREGIVSISIESSAGVNTELSVELQQRFGLAHVVVVDVDDEHPESLRTRLGQVAAEVLQEIVGPDDVLGLAWARSLRGIGSHITTLAPCPVVQLTGAQSGPDGSDVIDLVRRVAAAGGGTPHVYYAPLVAPDAGSARALRRQHDVSRAQELATQVTVAVVGIGLWQAGLSTIFDALDEVARERVRTLGVIGEISGALIDADGTSVTAPISKRIIGVTGEQLAAVNVVVSVAYGEAKAPAVFAALRSGLVTGLITHTGLARALLRSDTRPLLVGTADATAD